MNIAFLTTRLFDRPRSGGEICTARLLAELTTQGHQLHVIGRGTVPPTTQAGRRFTSVGPLVTPFEELRPLQQMGSLLAAWAAGQASTVQRLSSGHVRQRVEDVLLASDAQTFDAIVVDHLQTYAWVAALQSRLPRPVLVTHNVESDGYWERAQEAEGVGAFAIWRTAVFRREAGLIRRLEQHALRHVAVVACLSATDAQRMQALADAGTAPLQMEVLPAFPLARSLPTPGAAATSGPPPPADRPLRIGMLGTWTWGPNRDGLRWMLDKVRPHFDAGCELWLAGSGLTGQVMPSGVRSLGRIDEVQSFYDSVDVVAIASLGGSGVQEKAVEAIGSGRPVVATSHALRGLVAAPAVALPVNVNTSDDAAGFAGLCMVAARASADGVGESVQHWAEQRQRCYRAALTRCLNTALAAARS